MSPPHGIGGQDPREHASAAVGERNVELASQAIGLKGLKIEDPAELKPALSAAIDSDRPALIDVITSQDPHFRLMM